VSAIRGQSPTAASDLSAAARELLAATDFVAGFADRRWMEGEYVLAVTDARLSAERMERILDARRAVAAALGGGVRDADASGPRKEKP